MKKEFPINRVVFLILVLSLAVSACQPAATPVPATMTPSPVWTPTPTSTPIPQEMSITELAGRCEQLATDKREVIVEGAIYLPEESVSGYTIDGVTWLGMNLVNTDRVHLLVEVGEDMNTMNMLPTLFSEKDLILRADDGRLILNRHRIRITGTLKYREDKPDQECELFANNIESLEGPAIFEPMEITVEELLDGDEINDCQMVEYSNQLVRMRGWITVNENDTTCWYGRCRTPFSDGTGQMIAQLSNGGGNNSIGGLEGPYDIANVHLYDQEGMEVDPGDLIFIGQITGISEYCQITVYTILPGETQK